MKYAIISMLFPFLINGHAPVENYLITGTYTDGKSEGIYVYKFNSETGVSSLVSSINVSNPSFVAISPDQRYVYSVQENGKGGNGGEVASFSFDKKTGQLTKLNSQPSGGDHPCYVEVDRTGKWVFAGNYSSGTLSVIPVNADGSLGTPREVIRHAGSGPDKDRQGAPHVHCVKISPDNKWLYVPDLGIDKVMISSFDANTGSLTTADPQFADSDPGSGPRHITFHPSGKFAYLIEELTGTVTVYRNDNGKLFRLQRISTVKKGTTGFAGSAEVLVSPDGKFLYASNRGDYNNIAIYKVNAKKGTLSVVGFQPTLGKNPRNFNFDPSGKFLLVGNQSSDEIVVFQRNLKTGLLTEAPGQRIAVGKPVCLRWISGE